jgi:hypothetical protein
MHCVSHPEHIQMERERDSKRPCTLRRMDLRLQHTGAYLTEVIAINLAQIV